VSPKSPEFGRNHVGQTRGEFGYRGNVARPRGAPLISYLRAKAVDVRQPHVLISAFLFECGIGVVAALVGWLFDRYPARFVRWEPTAALAGTAAALPMLVALWMLARLSFPPVQRLTQTARQLVRQIFSGASTAELLMISLAAGFGEELLFRGLLQSSVADHFGVTAGLIVGGVLFGLAHPISSTYVLLAGLVGVYLGGIWIAADHNLLVPILAHAVYDFLALLYLLRRPTRPARDPD